MNYQSVLQRIEDEKKDERLSAKLFRYTGLMQAIEFFSQKLVFEQIIEAAFDFINELLLVDHSAIYVFDHDSYILKKEKSFTNVPKEIENTEGLKNLATFYGTVLYGKENISKFFNEDLTESLGLNALVPLIIEDKLYGFILVSSKVMSEDDYIISESLMKLINTALENFSRYEKLMKVNVELDEKIFNLFAINQSSKVLLSELRMDLLYNISIDVFSELTHSTITGFVLFDDKSSTYMLKSYKDVFYKLKDASISLSMNRTTKINPNKVIIDLSNEEDNKYFNDLFEEGTEQLAQLKTKYVVLILKSYQIFGFVTLSETVTGADYGESIFELIESLASSTYTALSNAKLFGQVNEQKRIIQNKLNKVISLNNLTKNINSSNSVETLMDMTTKTLELSFNVEKGAFCLFNQETNEFDVCQGINIPSTKFKIIPNDNWKRVFEGDCVFAVGSSMVEDFVGNDMAELVGDVQGILIVPICIDIIETQVLGALIIFKYENILIDNEEYLLTMETIAGHIAPVLNNLSTMKRQQRFLLPNYIEIFKRDLKKEINSAKECEINLTIFQITDHRKFLFKGNTILDNLKTEFKNVYPFSYNNIFIIENDEEKNAEAKIKQATGIKDLKIAKMVMGEDFKDFADFFSLYK
jgi:transcriptional regulator with GAF, ATPase, and Fis domain